MLNFEELVKAYEYIDKSIYNAFLERRVKGHRKKASELERLRTLNDQAYFVLLFAQFESRVNDRVNVLVNKKRRLSNWRQTRSWLLIDKDARKISFKDRVSLLMDRGSHVYRDIIVLYDQRNALAHGKLDAHEISIPAVVKKIKDWSNQLKT